MNNIYTTNHVRTIDNTLQLVQNIENISLKSKHPAAGTNDDLLIIHPTTNLLKSC